MRKLVGLVVLLFLVGCETKTEITTSLNKGYDIITVNSNWEDAGCVLSVSSGTSYNMLVDNTGLDVAELGEYEITYSYSYREVEYSRTRIVKVIDDIDPTIVLNSGIDTVQLGETWVDAGVVADDNFDTELTIVTDSPVDTSTIGRYIVTYTAIDDSMNETSIIRVVNIVSSE